VIRSKPIDGDLLALKDEIRSYAVGYGLDFFEVLFEECDYDTINILAAQGGFPSRYPHWRFGMEYDQLSKSYAFGLSKIYEMVINTDPSYAYLLKANHWVDQKIVMGHVYGHSDFFKNNLWFSSTNRNMMDVMANHGTKVRRYMEKYGHDNVEQFIDRVLSIENLLDVQNLFKGPDFKTIPNAKPKKTVAELAKEEDDFLNQDDRSKALQSYMRTEDNKSKKIKTNNSDELPVKTYKLPERDAMKFLMDRAPLHEWQADIVGILREEAYYFLPQRCTKIMNEGWASYWHSKIMTEKALKPNEIIDYADHHSGVLAMSRKQINPYKIGIELYRDIEERWNKGQFGKDYNDCKDMVEKERWDTQAGLGKEKIFEVRRTHNDITFIDEFFTADFCQRMKLFTYKFNQRTNRLEIDQRDFEGIKAKLLSALTNFGSPLIEIADDNYGNRSEILLRHVYHGADLDLSTAQETMKNIYGLWRRPVNLTTIIDDKECIFNFDGKEIKMLK
jgi:stage V sporulation protein R